MHAAHVAAVSATERVNPEFAFSATANAARRFGPAALAEDGAEQNAEIIMARFDTNADGIIQKQELEFGMQVLKKEQTEREAARGGEEGEPLHTATAWLVIKPLNKPLKQVLKAFAVMLLFDFGLAVFTGLYLNNAACGDASYCDVKASTDWTAERIDENMLDDGYVNFLHSPSKSAAVALALYTATAFVKLRCHPRVYGIYSFVIFLALAITNLTFIYSSRFTASSSVQSVQSAMQVISFHIYIC